MFLPQLRQYCHTGELESYHSLILKYCSKKAALSLYKYENENLLAALDWNSKSRAAVVDDEGKPVKYTVWSKARQIYVRKQNYKRNMMPAHVL